MRFLLLAIILVTQPALAMSESCLARMDKSQKVKSFLSNLVLSSDVLANGGPGSAGWVWPLHSNWRKASELDALDLTPLQKCLSADAEESAVSCIEQIRATEQSLTAFSMDVEDLVECELSESSSFALEVDTLRALIERINRVRKNLMPHYLQTMRQARVTAERLEVNAEVEDLKRQADAERRCQNAFAELMGAARRSGIEEQLRASVEERLQELGCSP